MNMNCQVKARQLAAKTELYATNYHDVLTTFFFIASLIQTFPQINSGLYCFLFKVL